MSDPNDGDGAGTVSQAGIYTALQGGADTYVDEREAAAIIRRAASNAAQLATENRAWVMRAVRYIVGHQGVRQILDLGCGKPQRTNVHQVAQAIDPEARVVYVDNDVPTTGRALLEAPGTIYHHADIADVEEVLAVAATHLDLCQPTALLLGSVMHVVPVDDPAGLIRRYVQALPSGSLLALSHVSNEGGATPAQQEVIRKAYAGRLWVRTFEAIHDLFGGLELVTPGLVDVWSWPHITEVGIPEGGLRVVGGIARI
ncbi:SAM-dependent methyltransferase [Actinocorallia herbida]|nr:SAM-dependent methyltransferase [Actinocorallia herbida]